MAEQALQAEEVKPKRHLGKLLFLGINFLLFLAGAGFFVLTKFGMLGSAPVPEGAPTQQEKSQATQSEQQEQATPKPGIMLRFDPFIVNLSGDRGRRYLRLIMQVEVADEQAKATVESRIPHIRDRLIFLLSSKTFADIVALKASIACVRRSSPTSTSCSASPS